MKTLTAGFVLSVLALALAAAPSAKADDVKVDPDKYGAVAYSVKTGKYGYAYNYDTRAEAEREAVKSVGASDAKVLTWVQYGWIVLVIADDGAYGYDEVHGDGVSDKDAVEKAIRELRKHSDAKIVTTVIVCSGNVKPKIINK